MQLLIGLVSPASFIMVVGHEGVWVMSEFLNKWEEEKERERRCKEREEKLSFPVGARTGKKKIQGVVENDTILSSIFNEQCIK